METEQLYVGDEKICPRTNYENDGAAEKIRQTMGLLDELAARVAEELLKKTDLADWAKRTEKPAYTAGEVGADAAGSAAGALADAKTYADGAYMQATGYTNEKIAALINGAPSTLDTLKEIADAMLENESVVEALEAAVGSKTSDVEYQAHAANGTVHVTASERNGWIRAEKEIKELAGNLDEMRESFQDGCRVIAGKLTACGAATSGNASPEVMAGSIQKIYDDRYREGETVGTTETMVGTATQAQVLAGYTFTNSEGAGNIGTMPDCGAVSQTLACGGSYTVPKGYHSGKGIVTANSLASQTVANAVSANISSGKTGWVNGVKVTGTGEDNTTNYNSGYSAGRTQGQNDVKNSPGSYSLYTKAQYDANYSGGRTQGQNDVKNNPNSYGLYTKAQYDANYSGGRTQGQNDVKNNPNSYGLYTKAQYDSNYGGGRARGQNDVKNSPNSYGLYTKAQYDSNYTNGYNAGVSASQKNLQVRAKGHESNGVVYFYVRIYNGAAMVFDKGSNSVQPKDGAGYTTIDSFTV